MSEFDLELQMGFLDEAQQIVEELEQSFLALETQSESKDLLEKIFRLAHNLKGSSKAVGFNDLGAYTHEFENFLLKCKHGQLAITPAVTSLLLKECDRLKIFVSQLRSSPQSSLEIAPGIQQLTNFKETPTSTNPEEQQKLIEPTEQTEQVDIPAPFSNSEQVNDFFQTKLSELTSEALTPKKVEPPKEISSPLPIKIKNDPVPQKQKPNGSDESIRVNLSRLDMLVNFIGELVVLQAVLKEQAYLNGESKLVRTVEQISKITKEVQDLSMGLRMVPIKPIFQKMQRIVRDTAQALSKNVSLLLEGEETEVDKTVYELIGDPLVHLIRNAADHGIESAETRKAHNKSETGQIWLRAFQEGGRLILEVQDDGGGIDPVRLRSKAVEKGIMQDASHLTDLEAIHLIFHPGFSTKSEVSEVSGRGVGMDVVKTNIESLHGSIDVQSTVGKGTLFRVSLPLSLSIIEAMIVASGNSRYVIPLSQIRESVNIDEQNLEQSSLLGEILTLRGQNLPVLRLSKISGERSQPGERPIAIVAHSGSHSFALLVDDIKAQQQVVVKKLGAEIQHISHFSGSTILGDGKPALILELPEIWKGTA